MHKQNKNYNLNLESGFTIVELLIVIVVIGILAAISIVSYTGIQNRSHATAVRSDLSNIAKKLEEYKILNDKYPATRDEFRAADLKFSLDSGRYAVYCVSNNSADPKWVLSMRSMGNAENLYVTNSSGIKPYTGGYGTSTATCDAAGITTPDVSTWLRGNGNWSDWVVY